MFLNFVYIFYLFFIYKIGFDTSEETFKNICIELASMNILFVKILQWFTYDFTDDPELSERLFQHIQKYCNHAPYTKEDINWNAIQRLQELKDESGYPMITMETEPSFSGTIALCYLGEMNSKPVIIKILRKNIEKKLDEFEYILHYILHIIYFVECIGLVPKKSHYFMKQITASTTTSFKEQCNFEHECNTIEQFYSLYENIEEIKIPQVYKEFTKLNKHVIVMEYLKTKYTISELTEEQASIYLTTFCTFVITSYYTNFVFHNDLHLGNILFLENNNNEQVIGIIDFGFVTTMNTIEEQNICMGFWNILLEKLDVKKGNDIVTISGEFIIQQYYNYNSDIHKLEKLQKFVDDHREKVKKSSKQLVKNDYFIELYMFIIKEDICFPPLLLNFLSGVSPIIGSLHKLAEKKGDDYPVNLLMSKLKENMNQYYQEY